MVYIVMVYMLYINMVYMPYINMVYMLYINMVLFFRATPLSGSINSGLVMLHAPRCPAASQRAMCCYRS